MVKKKLYMWRKWKLHVVTIAGWTAKNEGKQKYNKEKGIPAAKKKDLLQLCKKGYIPTNHHAFYESLSVTKTKEDDDQVCVFSESSDDEE